jgi:hypothetical protein
LKFIGISDINELRLKTDKSFLLSSGSSRSQIKSNQGRHMSKNTLRTYIVTLSCLDYRDNYSIKVKASSYEEATDQACQSERYLIQNCYLAKNTAKDKQEEVVKQKEERKLNRLLRKKRQAYYLLLKAKGSSSEMKHRSLFIKTQTKIKDFRKKIKKNAS